MRTVWMVGFLFLLAHACYAGDIKAKVAAEPWPGLFSGVVPTDAKPIDRKAYEPIKVVVRQGSLNTNLSRIVSELGWEGFVPHYGGDVSIPVQFSLEIEPTDIPVSPEHMRDVVNAVLKEVKSMKLRGVYYVNDKIVVATGVVR